MHLKNVGPAPEVALGLAPRLNLVNGDNGLDKSFLLDAWYCLTRRWPQDVSPGPSRRHGLCLEADKIAEEHCPSNVTVAESGRAVKGDGPRSGWWHTATTTLIPPNQPITLLPQGRERSHNYPPDQHMVNSAVLMGQLVAKADNAWPFFNAGK